MKRIELPAPFHRLSKTKRFYLEDGTTLDLDVIKTLHRRPPYGYRMRWVTRQSNQDVVAAVVDYKLRILKRFGIPKDLAAQRLAEQIREAALSSAYRASIRRSDDSLLRLLEKNPEGIVPIAVTRSVGSDKFQTSTFAYPLLGLRADRRTARISNDIAKRVPNSGLSEARIVSPFGVVRVEGSESGETKRITLLSRYRIINPATRLFRMSAGIDFLTQEEINFMNESFKVPLYKIQRPDEAK